jgi:hypothetical protein
MILGDAYPNDQEDLVDCLLEYIVGRSLYVIIIVWTELCMHESNWLGASCMLIAHPRLDLTYLVIGVKRPLVGRCVALWVFLQAMSALGAQDQVRLVLAVSIDVGAHQCWHLSHLVL